MSTQSRTATSQDAAKQRGYAAERAGEFKAEKDLRMTGTYHFIPIGFETFGAIGPAADKFFGTLGKLIKQKTGEPRSLELLKQRISLDIQRGNSASVLGTLPQPRSLDEVFSCFKASQ